MTDRPDAILLTPVLPTPHGAGRNLRAWVWLKELGAQYRTHVIVFGEPEADMSDGFPAASLRFVPLRPVAENRWRRRLAKILPFLVLRNGFGSDWLQAMKGSDYLPDGIEPERIVVFRLYLHDAACPVIERFPKARADMDLDDFESRSRHSIAVALWRLRRWRAALHEFALSLQYGLAERHLLRRYDRVHVAAPEDRGALAVVSRTDVAVFPNRLSAPPVLPVLAPTRLLFVGSLDYPPNELAARWLMDMAPLLRARLPHLTLTIIGRRPGDTLRRQLAHCPQVEFVEDAEDLLSYYGAALVVLVPLQAGGGTKFKTIEAFAHGRPVVSTREGVRGLGAEAGRHYLAAETTAEFLDAMERLAADPLLAQQLGQAGHRLWRNGFSL